MALLDNNSIEYLIWHVPSHQWTSDDWDAVTQYLLRTLNDFLQTETKIFSISIVDNEALCCHIRESKIFSGPLEINLFGIMGLEPIDENPYISVTLILFALGRRLSPSGSLKSTLELVYEKGSSGIGEWQLLGWIEDESGEYDGIENPKDLE